MKTFTPYILFLAIALSCYAGRAQDDNLSQCDEPPVRFTEEMPEFPGGMVAFMKWLTQNLHYPPQAKQQKQQGTVVVSFVINADGSVSNARLVRPRHALLDREAMRVLRMMPAWKPGQDHGKPCRTLVCIPIEFKI